MIRESERQVNDGRQVYPIARAYLRAGLSVIPIRRDGSKAPEGKLLPIKADGQGNPILDKQGKQQHTWDPFKERLPTEEELRDWYNRPKPPGIAIIGSRISGNLERLDFDLDAEHIFPKWQALIEAELPGLLARLCLVKTPRGGGAHHVYYRCTEVEIPGNQKLAEDQARPAKERTFIETRGEGGYTVAPGSPSECHETGRTWEHVGGPPLTELTTVTAAERDVLIRCARSFDRKVQEPPSAKEWKVNVGSGLSPGDDFNRRGPGWSDLLAPHGWTAAREFGGVTYWRRPEKERGWSATTGVCKNEKSGELFACFSSNASPFEGAANGRPCSCYSKFAVYALLNHGGDFKAAAKELARQGYGERRATRQTASAPHEGNGHGRDGFRLGPLVLRPGPAHRTPTRLTVPLAVLREGCQVDAINLATSKNGRKEAAELLSPHFGDMVPDAADVGRVFAAILAAAEHSLDNGTDATGPTLRDIVRTRVPQALRLTFATERGVWSEARRAELTRADFLAFCPGWLVDEATQTADGPADVPKLVEALRCALGILWSDLRETLPTAAGAALSPETAAAAAGRFRALLLRIWNAPCTHERLVQHDGTTVILGGSLASRAQERHQHRCEFFNSTQRPGWQQLHSPYAAWWRPALLEGEIISRLAMRIELAGQVRVELPGVYDQTGFTTVGAAFQVIDNNPGIPTRIGHSGARLGVLALDLSDDLLDNPVNWHPDASDSEPAPAHEVEFG